MRFDILAQVFLMMLVPASMLLAVFSPSAQVGGWLLLACLIPQLIIVFFKGIKIDKPAHILLRSIYPACYIALNFILFYFVLRELYNHQLNYNLMIISWIGVFFTIEIGRVVERLHSNMPYHLWVDDYVAPRLSKRQLFSQRIYKEVYWPIVLIYIYLVAPELLFACAAVLFIIFLPYFCRLFRLVSGVIYQVLGKNEKSVLSFVQEYDPQVIFYCTGAEGAVYQLNQWIRVLERCGKRVLILTREKHYFYGIEETFLPKAYARGISSIDLFLTGSTRVVLYPANGAKNVNMMRWKDLTHVFVNHGESDKVVNANKFLGAYDKLFVAGQMAADRVADAGLDIHESRFVKVGRPQTDMALDVVSIFPSKDIITLLYAPTWEGFSEAADYTSISAAARDAFNALVKDQRIRIIFKPHPYTGISKPAVKKALKQLIAVFERAPNVEVYGAEKNIHELMNESDLIVTDVSSVLNDYLYTEKPIIITNPLDLDLDRYHELFFSAKAAYILDVNMSGLGELIENIKRDDSLREQRLQIKEYSLGQWENGSLVRFNEQLDVQYAG